LRNLEQGKNPMDLSFSRRRFDSVVEMIGNTPLVPIRKLNPNLGVELWGKLEGCNPGGSIKDRIALSMIEAAEEAGQLKPGMTILEATSGNTGIGLALVSVVKGYKLLLTMSEAVSVERRKILAAYGAEFLLTPGDLGTDGAIERAYDLADQHPDRYLLVDQYNNPANPLAHYNGTAPEIWEQTDGRVTHFVASLGTTGTVMGCSRRLKELKPDIQVIAVEPHLGHKIQGLKSLKEAYVPGIFDKRLVDQKVNVADEDAFETARHFAKVEGMLVGMSSGAVVFAGLELCESLEQGVIVLILPDFGERYLSTELFTT
jgi:cysteinyl-tRNA synthetase